MRRNRMLLVAALILLAVAVSGEAADQPMVDLPDQIEVETGTLWLYGQEIAAPYQFQKTDDIWYLNDVQVVPKLGRSIEKLVQELDDVGQLLKEISEHISQLRIQEVEGLELSITKADLLRASSLVDSVQVLPDGDLGIWWKDSRYPVRHMMNSPMPDEPPVQEENDDQKVYEKLIKPLQDGWTVYYLSGCFYLKVPPGKTVAEEDLPGALKRELESSRVSQ